MTTVATGTTIDETARDNCQAGRCRYQGGNDHGPSWMSDTCEGWWMRSSDRPDGYRGYGYVPCPKRVAFKSGERVESSKLPPLFRTKRWDTFAVDGDNGPAYATARRMFDDGLKGIVLAGAVGVGKSHLAAAIVNEQLDRGGKALFCAVPALMNDLRAAVKDGKQELLLKELSTVPLLALDDLGAERGTEFALEQLFLIVNTRLVGQKATVITTNYVDPTDLIARLGEMTGQRIVSRLREMGEWVVLKGRDRRMKP